MKNQSAGAHGPVPGRHSLALATSRALLLLGAVAMGLAVTACVATEPAAPAATSPASSSPDLGQPGPDIIASAGPSGPAASGAALPTRAVASGATDRPGGGSSGGTMHNPLIVCVGPDQGPPCVQADDAAWVMTAESALPSSSRSLVATAAVAPTQACPAGAPAVACDNGATPVAVVTFKRADGSTLGRVLVYRTAAGQLEAAPL